MMDPFVPKHGPRPVGQHLCQYAPGGDTAGDCGQPAAWHVLWDAKLDSSLACDEHMQMILRRWVFDDRHPISADCNMPGALWLFKAKRCGFPDDPTPAAAAALASKETGQ